MQKKILIVDDDPGIQDILKIIFEKEGFDTTIFEDGIKLLKGDFGNPDIVLMDIQLSGTNGLIICQHLKSSDGTKNIPVVLISASVGLHDLAKKAGANDYIEKPFNINELRNVVQKCINQRDKV